LLVALRQSCPTDYEVTTELLLPSGERGRHQPLHPALAVVSLEALQRENVRPRDVSLAVVVTGPRTRALDLGPSRELYRRSGVASYWTVEQDTGRPRVHWTKGAPWLTSLAGRCFPG
jgi:hypothetical protein